MNYSEAFPVGLIEVQTVNDLCVCLTVASALDPSNGLRQIFDQQRDLWQFLACDSTDDVDSIHVPLNLLVAYLLSSSS